MAVKGVVTSTRDPFRTALFLLSVMTISRIHEHYGFIKVLRPALVATAAAFIYAYLRPDVVARRPLLSAPAAKVIAAFACWAVLSALFGISLGGSATFIINVYLKTLVYAFLLIAATRSTADFKLQIWAYIISTFLLDYTSLFLFKPVNYHGYARLSNLDTYDANDLGLVLLVGIALTLLGFQTARGRGRIFCLVTLAGAGAAVAKSGSRGAFLGLLALGAGSLFLIDGVSVVQRLAFIVITGAALTIFAPQGYWQQMSTLSDPQSDYNWSMVNGRRQVAIRGMGYMARFPVFGLGINNFAKAECTISDKALNHEINTGIRCTPPHNAYVESGAELGVPGLLLWIFIIPGGVIQMLMLRHRMPKRWANGDPEQRFLYLSTVYLALALIGYAVSSFFLSFAWTDISYWLMSMMAGVYVCVNERLARDAGGGLSPAMLPTSVPTGPRSGWRAAATAHYGTSPR